MDGSVTIIAGRDPLPPVPSSCCSCERRSCVQCSCVRVRLAMSDAMLELVDTLALHSTMPAIP
jgi:hypothetical protein